MTSILLERPARTSHRRGRTHASACHQTARATLGKERQSRGTGVSF
jgi:hypothetical protein